MLSLSSSRSWCLLAALSSPAFAAAAPAPQADPVVHQWRSDADAGVFTQILPIELTGDKHMDCVVLDGSTPVLLESPARHDAQVPIEIVASDLCVLRGSPAESQGHIVTVGPDGLIQHDYVGGDTGFAAVDIGDASWMGALLVISGEAGGLHGNLIVGLSADGSTLLQLHDHNGTWVPGPSITVLRRPHEIVLGHWDGDGEKEIILRCTGGLFVYGTDGTLRGLVPTNGDGGAVAVLEIDGAPFDSVALAVTNSVTPSSQLMIVTSQGVQESHDLGGLDVTGIGVSDFDQDGDEDVFVSSRSERLIRHYDNAPIGFVSSIGASVGSGYVTFELDDSSLSAPLNVAAPAFADFDWDGDPDMLFALEDSQETYLFEGAVQNADDYRVSLSTELIPTFSGNTIKLFIERPTTLHPAATHVRFRVWDQLGLATRVRPQLSSEVTLAINTQTVVWPLEVDLPLNAVFNSQVHSIEAQVISVNAGNGVIRRAWPAYIGAYSWDPATYNAIASAESVEPILVFDAEPGTNLGTGREAGGFVPKDTISPFDDIEVPTQ